MAVNTHDEPFSGGLVTSRPAHMLEAGEFVALTNCGYRFDSLRLLPAEPRLQTLTGTSLDFTTLGFMQFDDGTNFYVTQSPANTALKVIEASSAASTLTVGTYTTSGTLCVVPFRNQFLVLNGANTNQVVYHTDGVAATAPANVQHGVEKVVTKPGIAITTGQWPLGTSGLDQYYEYWFSEVVVLADGTEVESDVDANAVVTTSERIDALTDAVRITIPTTRANSNANYVNVYRSTGKVSFNDKNFPVGVRIATKLPASSTTLDFIDGGGTASSALTAGTVTQTSTAAPDWAFTSGSLQAALTTDDSNFATVVLGSGGYGVASETLQLTNFPFSGVTDPISGITVLVRAKTSGSTVFGNLKVRCVVSNGSTNSTGDRYVPLTNTETSYSVGGIYDHFDINPAWFVASNFTSTRFSLEITVTGTAGATITLDLVSVTLNYGQATSSGEAFPAVVLDINGESASVGANGKPPKASTGCIFEDALVCNDVAHPSYIWWGVPGNLHAVPSIYFNDFETPRNDAVTCLISVGARVAVGLETALWRINYLPTEDDATFSRGQGRAFDEVDPSFGIVGPMAATTFVGGDGRVMLAFVSQDGLRVSDLFSTTSACDDVNWRTLLTPASALSKCVLINYPRNYTLRLYYPAGDSTYLINYMDFLYHPTHLKNGKMKAVGPVTCGTASTAGVLGAVCVPSLHTGYSWSVVEAWAGSSGSGGQKLWRRVDPGTASATSAAPIITTRDMFLAGFGNEWKINDAWLVGGVGAQTPITWVPSMTLRYTNQATASAAGLNNVTATYNPTKFSFAKTANSITLSLTTATDVNDAAHGWDLLTIEGEGFGKEDD